MLKLCTFLNAYVVWVAVPSSPRSSEIQELDSNMQYLVYENHSKFIKASETIREVGKWGGGFHFCMSPCFVHVCVCVSRPSE